MPVETINQAQQNERDAQQQQCSVMGSKVVTGLDLIVDINRNGSRHAWNIAANHEHDSELAQRVRKAESKSGDESRP